MILPDRLPEMAGVELAATCLPGPDDCSDWYDAVSVPGGLGIAMADVAGRGQPAAALAERLRDGFHEHALDGEPPGEVLQHVNALVSDVGTEMSTLIVAIFNPETGEVRGANAGHPPALIRRGGAVERWDAARGLPLGVGEGEPYLEDTITLGPGDAMLLFTDGLIERRGAPLEDALERLERAMPVFGTADAMRTAVLEAMVGDRDHDDDVAVLALVVPAGG
jgi:serine phosphatase RsbU (regulator of sigma subunit)